MIAPYDLGLEDQMVGYWQVALRDGEITTYRRVKRFSKTKPGFEFMADGAMIRRQNSGWCGTPPISYKNYDGKWKVNSEGLVELSYAFWGGEMKEVWEVIEIDEKGFRVLSKEFETVKKK